MLVRPLEALNLGSVVCSALKKRVALPDPVTMVYLRYLSH